MHRLAGPVVRIDPKQSRHHLDVIIGKKCAFPFMNLTLKRLGNAISRKRRIEPTIQFDIDEPDLISDERVKLTRSITPKGQIHTLNDQHIARNTIDFTKPNSGE